MQHDAQVNGRSDNPDTAPILSLERIHKKFGGSYALQDVSLSLRQGEILALLGENGAGKSTLIKILAGVYKLDEGRIHFDGEDYTDKIGSLPIAFIHQDLGLIDWMTVTENVCLTRGYNRRAGLISWAQCERTARKVLSQIGFNIDPETRVRALNQTEQSLVAIARALSSSARIVVMDEPTASLPADEVARLFDAVRRMRDQGVSVIYVSHRLEEIFAIADRTVVLRDGKLVGNQLVHQTEPDELVRMIVGSAVRVIERHELPVSRDAVFSMTGATVAGVGPLSFTLRPGEILGLTGLRGAGQDVVGRSIFGLAPLTSGRLMLDGEDFAPADPTQAMAAGVRFASGDRRGESIVQGFSVAENLFLNNCANGQPLLSPIMPGKEYGAAQELGQFVHLRPNDPAIEVDTLSGGNQQKVVIGRWLNLKGKLLILEDPTAGVDVGAKGEIYRLLFSALGTGLAIIVISTDFVEVASICHRALVFSRGVIAAELAGEDLTAESLLSAAAVTGPDTVAIKHPAMA